MIFKVGKSFEDRVREYDVHGLKTRKEMSTWQTYFLYFPVQVRDEFEDHSNQWAFMQWVYRKKFNTRGDRYKWIYSLTDLNLVEDKQVLIDQINSNRKHPDEFPNCNTFVRDYQESMYD
jgi:hypothetical protein